MTKGFGYVYFAQAGKGGHIKIGSAFGPIDRLKTLQTGCPEKLILLGLIPSYTFREDESRLQNTFQEFQVSGEWFKADKDLLRYIDSFSRHPNTPARPSYFHSPEYFQYCIGIEHGREWEKEKRIRNARKLMESYNIPLVELAETLGVTYEEALDA